MPAENERHRRHGGGEQQRHHDQDAATVDRIGEEGVRIVILTTFELDEYLFDALRLGARDRTQLVVLAYETGLVQPGWLT